VLISFAKRWGWQGAFESLLPKGSSRTKCINALVASSCPAPFPRSFLMTLNSETATDV